MPMDTAFARVPVVDAWDETAALRAIRLELGPELSRSHERPGQTVKVLTEAGEGHFALASAPSPTGLAEILVKRGGRVADAALAAAAPGSFLHVSPPFGKGFAVEEARGRDLLLFAAGSGIGPIRALVQHVLGDRRDFDRVTLFYGQRRVADFAYAREHLDWERGGVRVILCPSRQETGWTGARGRVQEVARKLAFGGAPPGGAVAFACGMRRMVDEVRAALARAGLPPERVHVNF